MPRVISVVGLLHCAAAALASSPRSSRPVAYTIAGSDSGGGAGIQADLLTFHDLGVHGCSAITALTAQNSHEVRMVEYPSAEMFRTTLGALRDDLPAQAIKLGMLGSRAVIVGADRQRAFGEDAVRRCAAIATEIVGAALV